MTSTPALKVALLAYLQANLPALITAAGLPPVREWLKYDPGMPSKKRAPQLWVSVRDGKRSDSADLGATAQKYAHVRCVLVGITVYSGDGSGDPGAAADQLETYADLIRQTLETPASRSAPDPVAGLGLFCLYREMLFSPNFEVGTDRLFQGVAVLFEVPRQVLPGTD